MKNRENNTCYPQENHYREDNENKPGAFIFFHDINDRAHASSFLSKNKDRYPWVYTQR